MIRLAALVIGNVGNDHAGRQPHEPVDLPHPLGIAPREIVVDRDDVDALAIERIEIGGERGNQRLALAGAHLGDLAAVEHDAADHLHVVVPLAEHALGGLAHRRERLGQQIVESSRRHRAERGT